MYVFYSGVGVDVLHKPVKPVATVSEQIDLLRSRGMEVDTKLAGQWLNSLSYYRLSAYWYPARQLTPHGVRQDIFHPGTCFSDAIALYEADRKLRGLMHDGMERIEVALRTQIGKVVTKTGPLAYTSPKIFRPNFDHQSWISTTNKRINRAAKRRDETIRH